MIKKVNVASLVPLIIFIVLAVFLGIGLTLNPRDLPSTLINKPAPTFSLPILSNSSTTFSPQQLQGKMWLLNVWASWCAACRQEHPLLNRLAANTTIPIVGLNYKDTPQKATHWLQQQGNPYAFVPMDVTGDVGIDWGVYGVPETFVINAEGRIVFKHTGPINAAVLNQKIIPLFN